MNWRNDIEVEQEALWRLQAYATHVDRSLALWEVDAMLGVQPDTRSARQQAVGVAADDESSRTLGEIARRLDEVAARFENLANKLDTTYLRRETFNSYRELAEAEHQRLRDANTAQKELTTEHVRRIADLEEGRKWLSRWVFGAAGAAVISVVLALAQSGIKP